MMSLVGLYALLKTPLLAITTGRVLTLMTATIITNYNMKLLDIFKRKKNAELECLRDAYNTLDKQLQFVTRENESLRKANNRLSEQINGYKGRQKASDGVQKELNSLRKKYDKVCQQLKEVGVHVAYDVRTFYKDLKEMYFKVFRNENRN